MAQFNHKNSISSPKKRTLVIITTLLLLVVMVIIGLFFAMRPERSIASFCRVAKEEKSILTGDVDYQKRLDAYKRLEAVSPNAIQPDITTIRKGYEQIVQDPSKTLSTGFGMSGAENRRTAFINSNCKDF
jgi:hypothetical protein